MSAGSQESKSTVRKLGFFETIRKILTKDGIGYICCNVCFISCTAHHVNSAFWRGVGPALVLVINPVLQYTVFEQLKNALVSRRTSRLRATGAAATAMAVLTDWDFFLLGAVSKLGTLMLCYGKIKIIDSAYRFHSCNECHISLYVRGPESTNVQLFMATAGDSVVKSRMQAGSATALRYKSSLDGLLTIIREEGVEGLYKGIGSKLVQSVLTAAILFAGQRRIYELTKQVSPPRRSLNLLSLILFNRLFVRSVFRKSSMNRARSVRSNLVVASVWP